MATDYPIPAAPLEVSEEIKKSRFITYIAHTPTVEAAKAWIDEIKQQHPGPGITAGLLSPAPRKTARFMVSVMMANPRAQRANPCWPS